MLSSWTENKCIGDVILKHVSYVVFRNMNILYFSYYITVYKLIEADSYILYMYISTIIRKNKIKIRMMN